MITENRLREATPSNVFTNPTFIDIGGLNNARYRDLLFCDLTEYKNATIEKAVLALFWYYPVGSERLEDTIIEVYRPASAWDTNYVSWNKRTRDTLWANPGGDWIDKIGIPQGNTPFASITISGKQIPDNKYYELDVTELINGYVNNGYENTGFLLKAKYEDSNYIAFSSMKIEGKQPRLTVTTKTDNDADLIIPCESEGEARKIKAEIEGIVSKVEIYLKVE